MFHKNFCTPKKNTPSHPNGYFNILTLALLFIKKQNKKIKKKKKSNSGQI